MLVSLACDSGRAHADKQHGQYCLLKYWNASDAVSSCLVIVLSRALKVFALSLIHVVVPLLGFEMSLKVGDSANVNCIAGVVSSLIFILLD